MTATARRTSSSGPTGGVHRISGGNATSDSEFLGTDVNGDNVFFITDEALSAWDVDGNLDIYDARVDGGVPEPEIDAGCTGDGCQGDPTASPTLSEIGSNGATVGNPTPKSAPDCSRIQRRAKKAKRQSKRLARKAKRANARKKSNRLKRKAKGKKKQANKLERRVSRCQGRSR